MATLQAAEAPQSGRKTTKRPRNRHFQVRCVPLPLLPPLPPPSSTVALPFVSPEVKPKPSAPLSLSPLLCVFNSTPLLLLLLAVVVAAAAFAAAETKRTAAVVAAALRVQFNAAVVVAAAAALAAAALAAASPAATAAALKSCCCCSSAASAKEI